MDSFKEREAAAEAQYIHAMEAAAADRLRRVDALAKWASGLLKASSDDEVRYRDILYRLAIASKDDRIVIEQVCQDLARAGIAITKADAAAWLERSV
jgi:hypothetical protein